jgi:hypothetical protein
MQPVEGARKVQTTLRLPKPLYEQAKAYVRRGATAAATMNDFIVAALRAYTKVLERKSIDAAFRHMAEDAAYQKESQLISEEFTQSDWEALETTADRGRRSNAAR